MNPKESEEVMVTRVTDEEEIEMTETIEEVKEHIYGVVTNCMKLNVRSKPTLDAEVLCELKALANVEIDEKESTDDFYKITSGFGIEGYCVKDYISIKEN